MPDNEERIKIEGPEKEDMLVWIKELEGVLKRAEELGVEIPEGMREAVEDASEAFAEITGKASKTFGKRLIKHGKRLMGDLAKAGKGFTGKGFVQTFESMQDMAVQFGKLFNVSKATGAVLLKIGTYLGLIAGAIAIVAGLVKLFMALDDKVKEVRRSIIDAAGAIDLVDTYTDKFAKVQIPAMVGLRREFDKLTAVLSDTRRHLRYAVTQAEELVAIKAFKVAGVRFRDLARDTAGFGKALESTAIIAISFSRKIEDVAKVQGEWVADLGFNLKQMSDLFADFWADARSAGITTERFWGEVISAASAMGLYSYRLTGVVEALERVTKTGRVGAKLGIESVKDLDKAYRDMTAEHVMGVLALGDSYKDLRVAATREYTDLIGAVKKRVPALAKLKLPEEMIAKIAAKTETPTLEKQFLENNKLTKQQLRSIRRQLYMAVRLQKFSEDIGKNTDPEKLAEVFRGVDIFTQTQLMLKALGLWNKTGLQMLGQNRFVLKKLSEQLGVSYKSLEYFLTQVDLTKPLGAQLERLRDRMDKEIKASDAIKKRQKEAAELIAAETLSLSKIISITTNDIMLRIMKDVSWVVSKGMPFALKCLASSVNWVAKIPILGKVFKTSADATNYILKRIEEGQKRMIKAPIESAMKASEDSLKKIKNRIEEEIARGDKADKGMIKQLEFTQRVQELRTLEYRKLLEKVGRGQIKTTAEAAEEVRKLVKGIDSMAEKDIRREAILGKIETAAIGNKKSLNEIATGMGMTVKKMIEETKLSEKQIVKHMEAARNLERIATKGKLYKALLGIGPAVGEALGPPMMFQRLKGPREVTRPALFLLHPGEKIFPRPAMVPAAVGAAPAAARNFYVTVNINGGNLAEVERTVRSVLYEEKLMNRV